MGSPVLAVVRITAYLFLTIVLIPVQFVAVKLRAPLCVHLPVFYHRLCVRILGFRIRIHGEIERSPPVLFVCNHASYADITLLAAVLPASFVSKAEVAKWPFFGLLAKLQRTVFVERRSTRVARDRDEMVRRLENGDNLILFPEGTSSDGNFVLPFKSAMFAVAQIRPDDRPLRVQPVSLAYTGLDGMPVGRALRPYFAWYGDAELAGHAWQLAGLGRPVVDIIFHPAVTIDELGGRKQLADHCQSVVAKGVSDANAGRLERGLQSR